jgi:hypothetical protein
VYKIQTTPHGNVQLGWITSCAPFAVVADLRSICPNIFYRLLLRYLQDVSPSPATPMLAVPGETLHPLTNR